MAYLSTRGYKTGFLVDGLTGLAETLCGKVASDFLEDAGIVPAGK
jgi:hypothetical protein